MTHQSDKQIILIVDDEHVNIRALQAVLGREHHLVFATSGEEALERAVQTPQPDLILMDIVMPGLDGFEVCSRLKKDEKTRHIPVVFLTAKWETSEEAKGLQCGAVDYIRKPFSPPIIQARIRNHLELKRIRDMLETLSSVDALTGISNRRRFNDIYAREWQRASRNTTQLSLLFIDIDHFKKYNDFYGHLAGDECLRAVARALQSCLSRPGDFVARFGGEEFIVLLPDTDTQGAVHLAETIREAVSVMGIRHIDSPVTDHLTVSIGVVTCRDAKKCDCNEILNHADRMLYQAKNEGRNCVRSLVLP